MLSTLHVLGLNTAVPNAFVNHLIFCRRRIARHLNAEVATIIILAILPNASVNSLLGYT